MAQLYAGFRTPVSESVYDQEIYRHGFDAEDELLSLASDRRTWLAHRNKTLSVPDPYRSFCRAGAGTAGLLSQEEVKEIISYAADRGITVVPEIDMPGHAEAALNAYPRLGCFNVAVKVPQSGFTQNIFCAGKDSTLIFLKNVLDEVCRMFPSAYIHLGGDEAPKGNWDKCPDCRSRIEKKN